MKNNIRFNPSWSGAMALLAFSTLTQADGPVAASHSRYEPRGPVLTSALGSSRNGHRRDERAGVRGLPGFDSSASALKWTRSGAVEGEGNPRQRKSRQWPVSSRRIDSEPDASNTSELAHESVSLDPESLPDWEATQTLTYHWHQYAGTSLCSKVPFQLSVLPADTEPGLIVEDAQLGEHGCFCVAISPITAKGQAALYFNADEGQFDTHLSTLEVNGKPVPLDQLEPLSSEVPVQGHGLELSAALVEGLEGVPEQTPIRLDASQVKVRETPKGQGEGEGRKTPPPPSYDEATGGGGATGGEGARGGSGTGGGGGLGGSGGGQDPKKPRGAEAKDVDLPLAELSVIDIESCGDLVRAIEKNDLKEFISLIKKYGLGINTRIRMPYDGYGYVTATKHLFELAVSKNSLDIILFILKQPEVDLKTSTCKHPRKEKNLIRLVLSSDLNVKEKKKVIKQIFKKEILPDQDDLSWLIYPRLDSNLDTKQKLKLAKLLLKNGGVEPTEAQKERLSDLAEYVPTVSGFIKFMLTNPRAPSITGNSVFVSMPR